MYISQLKLWNFRIYGNNIKYEDKKESPDLEVNFQSWLNTLVWENDAWKSAIIDAIRLTLWTHAFEKNRINTDDDFHEFFITDLSWNRIEQEWRNKQSHDRFRIEIRFDWLSDDEAKNFIEWLGREGENPYLKLIYDVKKWKWNRVIGEVKAWCDEEGYSLNGEARDLLKCTYLKPLRDAENELTPWRNSRLWQILRGRSELSEWKTLHDDLVWGFASYKEGIKSKFEDEQWAGKVIFDAIQAWTANFTGKNPNFWTSTHKIGWILDLLRIWLWEDARAWLGSSNMLYMAVEMLHLEKEEEYHWLKLWLIEELEAHLHPQAQLKVVDYLQKLAEEKDIQLIITTHSPNLASLIKIEKLIYCFRTEEESKAYSLNKSWISKIDLLFLERYLDVTKANLFFAKWIIFVEWPTEEILLIAIAHLLWISLYQKGVSLISVWWTHFFNYANIFSSHKDGLRETYIPLSVSIVTDLDLRPDEYAVKKWFTTNEQKLDNKIKSAYDEKRINNHINWKKKNNTSKVTTFISPERTLEYCLANSVLSKLFKIAVLEARKLDFKDSSITSIKEIETEIRNIIDNYNTYRVDPFDVYWALLWEDSIHGSIGKSEISKPLIAQILSSLLFEKKISLQKIDNTEIESINIESLIPRKTEIESDAQLSYLVQAITHVCWTNTTSSHTNWD